MSDNSEPEVEVYYVDAAHPVNDQVAARTRAALDSMTATAQEALTSSRKQGGTEVEALAVLANSLGSNREMFPRGMLASCLALALLRLTGQVQELKLPETDDKKEGS